ncbi:MAG: hypothetical protein JWM85_2237 [Acidimicrobiaceae bacterium]|nr:hypothetical protein [Acidimicrobiaceae bacterium]
MSTVYPLPSGWFLRNKAEGSPGDRPAIAIEYDGASWWYLSISPTGQPWRVKQSTDFHLIQL